MVFLLIAVIGILNLFTISKVYATRQMFFLLCGIPICTLIISLNPRYIIKFSYLILLTTTIILIMVLVLGDISMGARRWLDLKIFKFQPSEISKLAVVIAIARYYHFMKESDVEKLKSAVIPVLITLSQVILILKQPDLGTSITICLIGCSMIFFGGLKLRYFIFVGCVGLLMLPIIWNKLHDYQKQRIKTFFNPNEDELGTGYNIVQAKIAIGSGGIFGKGIFMSTQGTLDFLPESQTDFAFTVFAEQYGFLGCLFLIFLYSIIIMYGFKVSLKSQTHFARLVSSGISSIFFFHIAINLAMTSGLIPVVGNPLPLISYGGTFLIANLVCFAILLNLDVNRNVVIHSSSQSYMEK